MGCASLIEFAMGFLVLVTTWQLWVAALVLVGIVALLMLACAREDASEDLSDDGSDGFRGSFGSDHGE